MNNLPGNLYILRKFKKLQQEDMQEALGVSRATWSNYENGKTEPQIQTLLDIAGYFEVSMDDLLRNDLSQHPDWKQKAPVHYQQRKIKKSLQNTETDQLVNDTDTPEEETVLQQILHELKEIRKHLTQQ